MSSNIVQIIGLPAKPSDAIQTPENLFKEKDSLNPEQLKHILDKAIWKIDPDEDPVRMLGRLAESIPLEKLEQAIGSADGKQIDALETAKCLFHEAKVYLEATEVATPSIRARLNSILDALVSILESFLNAFGISEFFKPAESEIHADFKGQKIMMLMSLFTMLTGILVPVIGPALGGMILGGTLLSIAALSLIYPYIRPTPSFLPQGENWTQQIQQRNLIPVDGRKESLDEIAQTLIASKNAKTHVMLLGKTGVGKTETAKAFAQALERGDYPELKGKRIFYFNTADLVNATEIFNNGNKILSRLSQLMGRHRENLILIFDEIHLACQTKERTAIGEQLKTYLDNGKDNFPYVIGITTEEEYYRDIYVNHPAFARRFKRITIQNTEDAETVKILNRFLLKQAPKTILEPNGVQTLLKKTKEAFGDQAAQPASSIKILSQCIKRTTDSQKSPLETKIGQVRARIQSIYSEGAVSLKTALEKETEAAQLESALRGFEEEFEKEKAGIDRLFRMRDNLSEMKARLFRNALDVSSLAKNTLSAKNKMKLKQLLLQTHFLIPILEKKILAEAKRLGVQIAIDSSLIGQVIDEELENDRKVQQMVETGKKQIASRKK